jgi:hypothetical protein
MAKVFDSPSEIKLPAFSMETYKADEEKFLIELKDFVIKRKPGKNVGEIVRFSYADGYAQYMIASMKPLELVHIPTGDAWHLPYVNRLTAKDIQANLDFENHWKTAKKNKDI